jgi:hypothetical protein
MSDCAKAIAPGANRMVTSSSRIDFINLTAFANV